MKWLKDIFVRQFSDIPRHEWPKALLLSAFFFLVIATYWIVKPLKRGLLINYFGNRPLRLLGATFEGAEAEQLGKILNMIGAFLLVMLFTWLVRRYRRQHLVLAFSALFGAGFASYSVAIGPPNSDLLVWSFYVFGDMFNTAMVVLFWAVTNDLSTAGGAKRTYGIIGLGGVLGGFIGATVVSTFVRQFDRGPLLLICVGATALIALIALALDRVVPATATDTGASGDTAGGKTNVALEGARLVFRSRYLLGIAGMIGCYELVSNVVDYQLAATVERVIEENLEKDAFFASVGQIIGLTSIGVQLLITAFVMRRFGIRTALMLLPLAIGASAVGFLVVPALAFVAAMSISDNALNYSINQSGKEALYTPTSQEVTYKAKAFIDMFIQRSAKVLSVGANLTYAAVVVDDVRWLSLLSLGVIALWIARVWIVSAGFLRRTSRERQPA